MGRRRGAMGGGEGGGLPSSTLGRRPSPAPLPPFCALAPSQPPQHGPRFPGQMCLQIESHWEEAPSSSAQLRPSSQKGEQLKEGACVPPSMLRIGWEALGQGGARGQPPRCSDRGGVFLPWSVGAAPRCSTELGLRERQFSHRCTVHTGSVLNCSPRSWAED